MTTDANGPRRQGAGRPFILKRVLKGAWVGTNSFNVELEHDLTAPLALGFARDDVRRSSFLANVLSKREFRVIAERPRETPHAKLLQNIREAAQANRWRPEIIAVLARVLIANGLVTEEEAEWLAYAGPAWSDDSD